jgi:hypothetical protein
MNKIYDLDALEAGRKRRGSVFVEPRSYYVSSVIAGTPKDFSGIFNRWPGLRRRFLILRMEEIAEPKAWEEKGEGTEELAKLHALLKRMENMLFFINLEDIEVLNEHVRMVKIEDPELKRKFFEYLLKLLYAVIIDKTIVKIRPYLDENSLSSLPQRYTVQEGMIEIIINNISYITPPSISITSDNKHAQSLATTKHVISIISDVVRYHQISLLSLLSLSCRNFLSDIKSMSQILLKILATSSDNGDIYFESPIPRYTDFIADVDDMLRGKQYIRLRDLLKNRHWTSDYAKIYLESMEEAGSVIVRRERVGGRESTLIIKPDAKFCGTCAFFKRMNECPRLKTTEDVVNQKPLDNPCEKWTAIEK